MKEFIFTVIGRIKDLIIKSISVKVILGAIISTTLLCFGLISDGVWLGAIGFVIGCRAVEKGVTKISERQR